MSENNKTMNRRQFLKTVGIALGAGAVACSGVGAIASITPKADMPTRNCAGDTQKRVLITYASKTGTTAEVATAIGDILCESGASVDVLQYKDAPSPEGYDAVVMGSAIYMGRPMGAVAKYLKAHQDALADLPAAYFVVGASLREEDTTQAEADIDAQMQSLYEIKPSADTAMFAGRLEHERLSPLYRTLIKAIDDEQGDWRDWDAIGAWGMSLNDTLLA